VIKISRQNARLSGELGEVMNEILWMASTKDNTRKQTNDCSGDASTLNDLSSQDLFKVVDFAREYVFKKQQENLGFQ